MFLAETLRLYPSAWAIGREAVRDTQIGGQPIRKGATVLVSPGVLHRDPWFSMIRMPFALRGGQMGWRSAYIALRTYRLGVASECASAPRSPNLK